MSDPSKISEGNKVLRRGSRPSELNDLLQPKSTVNSGTKPLTMPDHRSINIQQPKSTVPRNEHVEQHPKSTGNLPTSKPVKIVDNQSANKQIQKTQVSSNGNGNVGMKSKIPPNKNKDNGWMFSGSDATDEGVEEIPTLPGTPSTKSPPKLKRVRRNENPEERTSYGIPDVFATTITVQPTQTDEGQPPVQPALAINQAGRRHRRALRKKTVAHDADFRDEMPAAAPPPPKKAAGKQSATISTGMEGRESLSCHTPRERRTSPNKRDQQKSRTLSTAQAGVSSTVNTPPHRQDAGSDRDSNDEQLEVVVVGNVGVKPHQSFCDRIRARPQTPFFFVPGLTPALSRDEATFVIIFDTSSGETYENYLKKFTQFVQREENGERQRRALVVDCSAVNVADHLAFFMCSSPVHMPFLRKCIVKNGECFVYGRYAPIDETDMDDALQELMDENPLLGRIRLVGNV